MAVGHCSLTSSLYGLYRYYIHFSVEGRGIDATMTKALRGFKLSTRSILRNIMITRKRALVEYPFSVIKRVFHFSHPIVTLSRRARVKFMFSCFSYNIFAMRIIESEVQAIEIK